MARARAAADSKATEPDKAMTLRGFAIPTVWIVAAGGWAGRGIQAGAQFVALRVLLDALGPNGYGAFAVLASLSGWLLLSDAGIGMSVQNHISERRAGGRVAGDVVLTGLLLASATAVLACGALILLSPWLAELLLGRFPGLSASARTAAFCAMVVPGIGATLGSVVYRVWFAEHRGYLSSLLPAAGTVIGTGAVWLIARNGQGLTPAIATLAYNLPLALLPLTGLVVLLIVTARSFRPNAELIRPIMGRAGRFWVTNLMSTAILGVDYIVMSRVLGANDIVLYSVGSKLFLLIFFMYNALLQALWPVSSEALARGDFRSVDRLARRYIILGWAFTLVAAVGVAIFNERIVSVLAPGMNTPLPSALIVMLTCYILLRVWTDMFGMMLQSMNDLLSLWVVALLQAILSVSLQTFGAWHFGLPGLVAGQIGCFLLTAAWVLPLRYRRNAIRARLGGAE